MVADMHLALSHAAALSSAENEAKKRGQTLRFHFMVCFTALIAESVKDHQHLDPCDGQDNSQQSGLSLLAQDTRPESASNQRS